MFLSYYSIEIFYKTLIYAQKLVSGHFDPCPPKKKLSHPRVTPPPQPHVSRLIPVTPLVAVQLGIWQLKLLNLASNHDRTLLLPCHTPLLISNICLKYSMVLCITLAKHLVGIVQ